MLQDCYYFGIVLTVKERHEKGEPSNLSPPSGDRLQCPPSLSNAANPTQPWTTTQRNEDGHCTWHHSHIKNHTLSFQVHIGPSHFPVLLKHWLQWSISQPLCSHRIQLPIPPPGRVSSCVVRVKHQRKLALRSSPFGSLPKALRSPRVSNESGMYTCMCHTWAMDFTECSPNHVSKHSCNPFQNMPGLTHSCFIPASAGATVNAPDQSFSNFIGMRFA